MTLLYILLGILIVIVVWAVVVYMRFRTLIARARDGRAYIEMKLKELDDGRIERPVIEDEIKNARELYDQNAKEFRRTVESFPSHLIASIFHFEKIFGTINSI